MSTHCCSLWPRASNGGHSRTTSPSPGVLDTQALHPVDEEAAVRAGTRDPAGRIPYPRRPRPGTDGGRRRLLLGQGHTRARVSAASTVRRRSTASSGTFRRHRGAAPGRPRHRSEHPGQGRVRRPPHQEPCTSVEQAWAGKRYTGQAPAAAAASAGDQPRDRPRPPTRRRVRRPTTPVGRRTHQRLDQPTQLTRPTVRGHPRRPRGVRDPLADQAPATPPRPLRIVVRQALG